MIIFGHNNFLLKSYSAKDLGIGSDQELEGIQFQIRQRYAHIFWIPFFPIGKLWAIQRAGDKNLYQMSEDVKSVIKARHGSPGTPWYSFALLLLGLTIGLFMVIGEEIDNQKYEDRFYNTIAESKMLIQYPTTGDCYVFRKYEDANSWKSEDIILKVKKYNENETQFISLYKNLYKEAESEDRYKYHKSFDLKEPYDYNPTFIKKTALKKALNQVYHGSQDPIKLEPLKGYYILDKIDRRELKELE